MNGPFHRARLARERIRLAKLGRLPIGRALGKPMSLERAAEIGRRWLEAEARAEADRCAHDLGPDTHVRDADGNVTAVCPKCGEDFPVVDVAYEVWRIVDPVRNYIPGGTARQRRLTRVRRLQRARRWRAYRAGRRVTP